MSSLKDSRWNSAELWSTVSALILITLLIIFQMLATFCGMRGPHEFDGCEAYVAILAPTLIVEIPFLAALLVSLVLYLFRRPSLGTRRVFHITLGFGLWSLFLLLLRSETIPPAWFQFLDRF